MAAIQRWQNRRYARRCVRDAIMRGEAPIASHLLLTQRGILRDGDPDERKMGIEAGLAWLEVADTSVVYVDRGVSHGMVLGIKRAKLAGVQIEYRTLRERPEGFHGDPRTRREGETLERPSYAAGL